MDKNDTSILTDKPTALLNGYMNKGATFLGVQYPIICGAMTWVSDHKLVGSISNLGGFGQLAGGNSPIEALQHEIEETRKITDKPFGVNLITVAPAYQQQLDLVTEMGCDYIIFAGSIPRAKEISKAKDSGAKVICFASTEALAFRLINNGADALILEGSEAGGHIGSVALSVLLQQILFKIDTVPVFTAGGISTGKMMAHMLMMGAAGIQMGTRFVVAEECSAHERFKLSFQRGKARDAMATPQFDSRLPVIPVRALKNKGTEEFNKLQLKLLKEMEKGDLDQISAQYEVERFWMGGLRRAVVDGDVATGSMMAGQSVGLVKKVQPLKEILKELLEDGEATLKQVYEKMKEIA